MGVLHNIIIAISVGIVIGVVIGGLKSIFRKRAPSQKQIEFMQKFVNRFAIVLKYSTISVLVIGLLWCIYFLLLYLPLLSL